MNSTAARRQAIEKLFVIRCSTPDCDWNYPLSTFEQTSKCYESFRAHCMEAHHLAARTGESWVHLDLEKLLLSLF